MAKCKRQAKHNALKTQRFPSPAPGKKAMPRENFPGKLLPLTRETNVNAVDALKYFPSSGLNLDCPRAQNTPKFPGPAMLAQVCP
jgi:hypothetical protein